MKKALTLTIVANMTANYSEGLGNISSVQKVFKNKKVYSIRSRESLKNAIMVQSGLYDDLQTEVDGATQKLVTEDLNAANCKALEGGYMSTKGTTYIRKSSFYLTDAISTDNFVNETRFHNNLYLASTEARQKGINLQEKTKDNPAGLMPYQYEYDKSLKVYSLTIDLEMVGKDENFNNEASSEEKAARVKAIVETVENLSLVVKGNLDNAEPIFIVGGMSPRKTHYFENVVRVQGENLELSEDLIGKLEKGFSCGLLKGKEFLNEDEIVKQLKPKSMTAFFGDLYKEIDAWYGV
ncbi:MAG: type I-B CRISPR-associated protein Cas7/Cst2/DevR [Acetobacterium sp. MES1]|uniref:type I-B CRISPR-associated protein Cas7/Cst2/DevR n=1 Tax=Acetobacterium sp. MES1 TaxID=1899015 RepID=UPI000B9CF346|nr:type I-B CRISPR-associated protein Cas7/Cst2/DevR [Acetobacterium sp. MES1]OXS24614.1 MAG: type I-B CRISPR-associated protein Cas7/Cst2/DevR [Acetobacterium sp. MES1]